MIEQRAAGAVNAENLGDEVVEGKKEVVTGGGKIGAIGGPGHFLILPGLLFQFRRPVGNECNGLIGLLSETIENELFSARSGVEERVLSVGIGKQCLRQAKLNAAYFFG